MAIQVFEKVKSRGGKESVEDPSINIIYGVLGTDDENAVDDAIRLTSPEAWNFLTRQSWQREFLGGVGEKGLWEVTVLYDRNDPKGRGAVQFSFDTSGGKEKITQSKATIESAGASDADGSIPRSVPDCKGAIGVTDTSIEGVEITVPKLEFTITCVAAASALPPNYIMRLKGAVGSVNDDHFRVAYKGQVLEFGEQELLFLGGPGSYRGNGDWEFNLKFAASDTVEDLVLGQTFDSISGEPNVAGVIRIARKRGWEYLWVFYKEQKDGVSSRLVRLPLAAYVERVYDPIDFDALFAQLLEG